MRYPNKRCESVIFNGITFRCYPDSPHVIHRNYYSPSGNYRKKGVEQLHREIWKAAHGPIPMGYDVHHKDRNPLNNDPSNLECLSRAEHNALHEQDLSPKQLRHRQHVFGYHVRPKAANWHRSEEGREWHRELSYAIWDRREIRPLVCGHCGVSYETRTMGASAYCSRKCKAAARRKLGIDNETKPCLHCGISFTTNKYEKVRFCSRRCATTYRRRK